MASSSFMLALSLMILLVSTQNLSSVAVVAASALPAQIPGVSSVASSKPTKVSVALYHEAFCPGCTDFIVKYFPKIFLSGITDIMDLKLVPYGNAIVGENNTIICQHGSEECFLNQVEACAIHAWPDMAFDNLLKAVCNAYKATPLPRVCQEPTTDINPEAKSNSNQEVCYVDEASPTAKVRSPGTTWRRLMKF